MSLRIYHRRHPRLDPRQKPPLGARLDPEHPLSRGLVCRWLLNEGVGNRAGSVGPNKISGRIINPLWRSGGLGFDGVSTHCVAQGAGGVLVGDHTVHMRLRFEVAEGDTSYRCLLANRYDNLHGTIIFIYGTSNRAIVWDTPTGSDQYRWSTRYNPPNKQEVVTTFRCKMGTGRSLYVNGQFYAGTSSIPANPEPGLPDAFIGFDPNPSYDGYYFSGTMWDVAIWRRALSDDEIAWLYAEPYAGLLPPTSRRIYSYSRRPRVPRVHHVRRPRLDPRQKPPLGARLDPEHSLSKGLVLCLLFNEGIGNRISDLTNPNLSAVKTGSGSFSWEGDAYRSIPDESGGGPYYERGGAYFNFGDQQRHRGLTQKTIAVAVCNLEDIWQWILTKGYGNTAGGWALGYHGTMKSWMHSIRDSEGNYRNNYFGPAPIGEWTHVVVTYDAALPSGNMRGYVNGKYSKSFSCPGVVLNPSNALTALADGGTQPRSFNGLVKHIRLYNRALTDDEIAWLYAEPYAGLLPPTSRRIYSYSRRGIIRARTIDGTPFGGSIIR